MVENVVRIPSGLYPQQLLVMSSPITIPEVYILTTWCVRILKLGYFWDSIASWTFLEISYFIWALRVLVDEKTTYGPHEWTQLRIGCHSCKVPEPDMVIKKKSKPTKVTSSRCLDLFLCGSCQLSKMLVMEELF